MNKKNTVEYSSHCLIDVDLGNNDTENKSQIAIEEILKAVEIINSKTGNVNVNIKFGMMSETELKVEFDG